ncbi:MAG TPA: biliverdin-producing heme oxygenase [Brevundimonas sp.]|uniref:biliverdin-producing heme oxygenase n=1 Tax=Brevundimonas sp. TaxID=1871086 RepID=UPI002DF43BBD|nr:biliverdin-producing heme oxygenase [Brevundimonas sp.]
MKISPVHAALRDATAGRHARLEVDADVEARLRDPARRGDAVAGLHAFHAEADRKTARFAAGLMMGGREPALASALDVLQTPARPATVGEATGDLSVALGWTYVAEGSALGGRVMRKAMIRDGVDLTGLDFLDPHGDATGPRWLRFLDHMDAAVSDGRADLDAVVEAAAEAFDRARAALVPFASESRAP